jgi:predicted nuclease of predicted toxin-antitoxin system
MRFLLDENLPSGLRHLLAAQGHEVFEVKGSVLESRPDEAITEFAVAGNWIVMTMDLDYPIPGAPNLPGLVLLRLGGSVDRDVIIEAVAEFIQKGELQRVLGQIAVVTRGAPTRWRSVTDA